MVEVALVSCEAWPAKGIEHYQCVADGDWGYLRLYADGRFEFDTSQVPSRAEILARWAFCLDGECLEGEIPGSAKHLSKEQVA